MWWRHSTVAVESDGSSRVQSSLKSTLWSLQSLELMSKVGGHQVQVASDVDLSFQLLLYVAIAFAWFCFILLGWSANSIWELDITWYYLILHVPVSYLYHLVSRFKLSKALCLPKWLSPTSQAREELPDVSANAGRRLEGMSELRTPMFHRKQVHFNIIISVLVLVFTYFYIFCTKHLIDRSTSGCCCEGAGPGEKSQGLGHDDSWWSQYACATSLNTFTWPIGQTSDTSWISSFRSFQLLAFFDSTQELEVGREVALCQARRVTLMEPFRVRIEGFLNLCSRWRESDGHVSIHVNSVSRFTNKYIYRAEPANICT